MSPHSPITDLSSVLAICALLLTLLVALAHARAPGDRRGPAARLAGCCALGVLSQAMRLLSLYDVAQLLRLASTCLFAFAVLELLQLHRSAPAD